MSLALDPPVSERQARAMFAARAGKSTLGIPASVAREFLGKDGPPPALRQLLRTILDWLTSEEAEDIQPATVTAPSAGMVIRSPEKKVLMVKRATAGDGDHPGEWAFPGGRRKEGEDAFAAALRETHEETGHEIDGDCSLLHDGGGYATFLHDAKDQFEPVLNDEHTEHRWVDPRDPPEPLHPGVVSVLEALSPKLTPAHDALAFDRQTSRTYDSVGRLHVAATNISKANVCDYLGSEVPGWEELGLDPRKIYKLYRDPDELRKAAASFNGLPLLLRHEPTSAEDHPSELVIGATGTDAEFVAPYLRASLVIWPQHAIDAVENEEKRQLSCGYEYTPVMRPGTTPDGEPFDGRMTQLSGNHVSIVQRGRAGSDVLVGDTADQVGWSNVEAAILALRP
jgi:8-oxo-dGTP pyrophosphatase MutT (NUDIX family)